MKKSLAELHSLARIIAHVFKGYTHDNLLDNHAEFQTAIFKNYNQSGVEIPRDIKKPFGYKAVLESFAKSLGYNTYNGLSALGRNDYNLDSCRCLMPLNPYPKNAFYTAFWRALTTGVVDDLLEEPLSETVALGFKSNSEQEERLRFSVGLKSLIQSNLIMNGKNIEDLRFQSKFQGFHHYYGIATSIYSYALGEELVLTKDDEFDEDDVSRKLGDYVLFNQWDGSDFQLFAKRLNQMMKALYCVQVFFVGVEENPLDRKIVLVNQKYYEDLPIAQYSDETRKLYKDTQRANQDALRGLAELRRDNNHYKLSTSGEYLLYSRDDSHLYGRDAELVDYSLFMEKIMDSEQYAVLGEQPKKGEALTGTKMYLLNLLRYEYPLGHKLHGNAPSVNDVLTYWQTHVLDGLVKSKTVKEFENYFVYGDFNALARQTQNTLKLVFNVGNDELLHAIELVQRTFRKQFSIWQESHLVEFLEIHKISAQNALMILGAMYIANGSNLSAETMRMLSLDKTKDECIAQYLYLLDDYSAFELLTSMYGVKYAKGAKENKIGLLERISAVATE